MTTQISTRETVEAGRDNRSVDPGSEDAFWKDNYATRAYVDTDAPYDEYQAAFRTGYEGRARYPGRRFEEVEQDLAGDYERFKGSARLTWERAKQAARDAWHRVEKALPGDADGDGL